MVINILAKRQIEVIKEKCEHIKPLVVVWCATYNHASYISSALDGFISQETKFPFVVIVHDDASSDSTSTIVLNYAKKHPNVIIPIIEKENQYSHGGWEEIMKEAIDATAAKYVALCEGDDYWIDPYKLQKQVNFLESHPDYGMCYTNFNIFNQETKNVIHDVFNTLPKRYKSTYNSPDEFVLAKGFVCPPSWLIRQSVYNPPKIKSIDGTFVYFTHFLATTKVKYIPEITTTYRLLQESASHSTNIEKTIQRNENIYNTQIRLIEAYNLNENLKEECTQIYYTEALSNFVIANKINEIKKAKSIINKKNFKIKLLFLISSLHCGWIIRIYRNLKKPSLL